ncbi:MAG: bifunctional 5,10-methylene-tetrahydrofolate dehydrogenase/5,10-methylene-tetrahydrofolate cyclohydrolase [Bacteroidales bacterium]|nr:bifunctional 5,10-methylene-tetrahydrofolate dehydrogenase/5,10-methylene-tetrahydrofolate cyclohydrolase [Bacteroidales bacterium]
MKIIDGKATASEIKLKIAKEVAEMINRDEDAPHLAAVLVGDDPASHTYVNNKEKSCKEVGFISSIYKHPASISEKELLKVVDFINNDDDIDGLIVQLPLPKHISVNKVIESINPAKDVDGFHPVNIGKMVLNLPTYLPATPFGILQLFDRYKIETEAKNCVVLGRSHIVGSPISILLSRKAYPGNCTVTVCHSKTRNLKEICSNADILIAAIGQPGFVSADMVKKDAVVIDVGIHRVKSSKTKSGFRLIGDVKFDEVSKKCSYISPVPGGVGPMTIVSLLSNTLKAFKKEVYH